MDQGQQEIVSDLMKVLQSLHLSLNSSDMNSEKVILESLSSLYGLLGHFVGNKSQTNNDMVNYSVQEICGSLVKLINAYR